jgi:hypothetical protein
MGYTVTVYGDPIKPCVINGVRYFPYYWFNRDDEFNILINWRSPMLVGKVKAKKLLIDLHDIFNPSDYTEERLRNIDKIMVKSRFHRELAPNIPDEKIVIISNCLN